MHEMGHLRSFQPFSHLLLFFIILPLALSEIKNIHIVSDSRPLILFEQFGYLTGGAAVSVKGVSWKPPPLQKAPQANTSLMGFFLIEAMLYSRIMNESEQAANFCPISSHFVIPILKLQDLSSDGTCTRSVDVKNSDEYSLLFGNCNAGFEVTMEVRTEMYNIASRARGGEKDYLPAGKMELPKIYFTFFVFYLGFLVVWIVVCVKQLATAHKIHAVMAALLLFKALKLVCAAEDAWYVSKTGTPHGWDVAFYVFGFFKGVLLFTVLALIGTGWFFLKPYLQEREKDVLMLVIPLQVIENIAAMVIGETGPSNIDWIRWNQLFLVVDIICCCAVFVPILWSIRSLREASRTDGKAARNLQKLTLFKQFYMVVVFYLYSTRIFLPAVAALLSYRYEWCINAAMEGASLAFYLFVFVNFRPVEKNPYLFIGDEDEEAAAKEAMEMEDLFE